MSCEQCEQLQERCEWLQASITALENELDTQKAVESDPSELTLVIRAFNRSCFDFVRSKGVTADDFVSSIAARVWAVMEENYRAGREHDLAAIAMTTDDLDTRLSIISLATRYQSVLWSTIDIDWHFDRAFGVPQ